MTTAQQAVPGTFYPRSAFGTTNPNAGRPANGDRNAWGGYAWPEGVPSSKLGTATYRSQSSGQTINLRVRVELVTLWTLVLQIMDQVHRYAVWANVNGENWGPWAYENRPVGGTQNPSGHSMAMSVDFNAPWNPMSWTWQTNMPPAMVADLESLGLFWGGRYVNQQTDTMHYGYCFPPASVAGHVSRARQILAGSPGSPGDDHDDDGDDDMALSDDDVNRVATAVMQRLRNDNVVRMTTIDSTGTESVQDVPVTRALQSAQTQSARAAFRSL